MSVAPQPEFFFDRSLGKVPPACCAKRWLAIHLIADHYPDDAESVEDEVWIAEGCRHGWSLLTKDRKIRYRAKEFAALDGHLFCLANGYLTVDEMARTFDQCRVRIERAIAHEPGGFWHVYHATIKRMATPARG